MKRGDWLLQNEPLPPTDRISVQILAEVPLNESQPVHIYHGKDDNIVPLTASQKAMKRLKDARLTTLEDTGHALTPEQQAQIGFEIADEIYNGMK